MIGYSLWILLLLLIGQGILSATRAVLNRSWRGFDEEEGTIRRDITGISITLDLALMILWGLYFAIGVGIWFPVIRALEQSRFAGAMGWLAPVTYVVLLVLMSWISLVLGALAPEAIGAGFADAWGERLTALGRGLFKLLKPLSASALTFSNAISRLVGSEPLHRMAVITEEEIKSLVSAGEQEGIIEEEEREMIYSIFQLSDTITREVMLPRTDILALDVNTPMEQVLDAIMKSGHSRIPVYAETIDNIVGILYAKDLLQYQGMGIPAPTLKEILRPAYFVPESKRLDTLLREMQKRKVQVAIVVDEYGGVAGLVTLEDIVEEIIGEIQDEYDLEEPEAILLEDGSYLFEARIPLDDVQDILGIPLPVEEIDSLGGFVYNQLGHIPATGETITFNDTTFEVAEIDGRRILKVRAVKTPPPPQDEGKENSESN